MCNIIMAGRERLGGSLERFNYRLRPQCIINDSHSLTSNIYHCPGRASQDQKVSESSGRLCNISVFVYN